MKRRPIYILDIIGLSDTKSRSDRVKVVFYKKEGEKVVYA
ncbi:MAG: hypothetical protein [Arizlama microvirus]|nr:MAG: hypothetical protein [Arizlama microvirus]